MKNMNVKELLKKQRLLGSITAIALAVTIGGAAFFQNAGSISPEFPSIIDPLLEVEIAEEEVPLASAPRVSTKTDSKVSVKNVKLDQAAPKTYSSKLPTTTKTATKKTATDTENISTKTTVKTAVTERYTKQSDVKRVYTKVVTTVTTTATDIVAEAAPTPAPTVTEKYTASIDTIAPLMDSRVTGAFKALNFSLIVDPDVNYSGYFNAREQSITLNAKQMDTFADTVYHELGHFLAFLAGNVDTKADFAAIYAAEKNSLPGVTQAYASQSASEFFGESVRIYTINPTALQSSCPKTYEAITKALNSINDTRIAMFKKVYGAYWTF